MGNMLLSIITITYNNLEGLKKTCTSIVDLIENQDVEWIVVDGNSSDGTLDFLKNNKVALWQSEPDQGIYDAMNKGLKKATGDYVWFLNAGDLFNTELSPSRLKDELNKKPDILYSDTMLTGENGLRLGLRSQITTRALPQTLTVSSFKKGMVVSHQSFIPRREICNNFNLHYAHVADYNWVIETTKRAKKIAYLEEPISLFDTSGHSSQHRLKSNKERFKVMTEHFGWLETCWQHLKIVWVNLTELIKGKPRY